MPLSHQQALAQQRSREAARFASWSREATRAQGVGFGSIGGYEPATEAELEANARADVRRSNAFAASPEGRFLACVRLVERAAFATGDAPLHAAAERALASYRRGLRGELDHAENCLTEIELCGGEVRAARAALTELNPQPHSKEAA